MLPHGHKVEYAPKVDSQQILFFYMGKTRSSEGQRQKHNVVPVADFISTDIRQKKLATTMDLNLVTF